MIVWMRYNEVGCHINACLTWMSPKLIPFTLRILILFFIFFVVRRIGQGAEKSSKVSHLYLQLPREHGTRSGRNATTSCPKSGARSLDKEWNKVFICRMNPVNPV